VTPGLVAETYPCIGNARSPLQKLADIYTLAEQSSRRRSRQRLNKPLAEMDIRQLPRAMDMFARHLSFTGPFFAPFFAPFFDGASMLQILNNLKENNQYIMEDLRDIGDLITAMDCAGKDPDIEHHLRELKERVFKVFLEYMDYATNHFQTRTSKFSYIVLWRH
jgi:hypothetical protein